MSLSEISVKRKIAMTSFILMLIFGGIQAYLGIGIDAIPKQDVPYVQITTVYPGASPEEIEVDVARRIEDAVASLDGLKHTTSICMENVCATTLEFELGNDVDQLIHEVREKLNLIVDEFPDKVETPKLSKINMNAVPVATMFLTGRQSIDELYDYADDKLSDRFASIPGVGEVRIHGGNEVELHIILDRQKLTSSNISIDDIITRIQSANLKIPAGRVKQGKEEMSITFDAEFRNITALKELEIGTFSGKRVYLGDIAEIKLMSLELRQDAYYKGERGIQIEIVKKSDANAVKVIAEVRKRYEEIINSGTLPGGMKLNWFKDSEEFIQASVDDAWSSIGFGILLTTLILLLFLHDLRTTFIAAISMPVSIVISFMTMKLMDYTFDMITLVSLGCSAGVLVTNAVVVLENISKKIQAGADAKTAAVSGTNEVLIAVAASALTNVVVFVPVMMMGSIVGMIVSPFAGVMVAATLASLFASFTLTPILASIFLARKKNSPSKTSNRFFQWMDNLYLKTENVYTNSLCWVRKHCIITALVITLITILLAALSLPHLSMSFIPSNDKREVAITLEFPTNMNLAATRERSLEIMKKLSEHKEVEVVTCTMGYINAMMGQVSEGVYLTEINLYLTPKGERKSIQDVANELRDLLAQEENMRFAVNIPTPMGTSGAEFTGYITGPDQEVLQREGEILLKELQTSGIGKDVDSSMRPMKPRVNLIPYRSVLKNLNIPEAKLGTAVAGYFDGIEVGSYKVGTRSYDIRLKTTEEEGFDKLKDIAVVSVNGKPVNMDSFMNFENDPVSISVIRQDKERSIWLYANCAPGKTIGDIITLFKEHSKKLPPGYKIGFNGPAAHMDEGASEFAKVFLIAVVMTYLLIAALTESWTHPFLIMFTVPLGFAGMFFTMYLFGEAMSMIAMLGGVMMIGIVVNNAILIMDETNVLIRNGSAPHDAMLEAAKNKFRPILMTSLASVIGMLPMAFGDGIGSEMRVSCGLGVVGGLTFSAVMTVYLIPALYFIFTKKKNRVNSK